MISSKDQLFEEAHFKSANIFDYDFRRGRGPTSYYMLLELSTILKLFDPRLDKIILLVLRIQFGLLKK